MSLPKGKITLVNLTKISSKIFLTDFGSFNKTILHVEQIKNPDESITYFEYGGYYKILNVVTVGELNCAISNYFKEPKSLTEYYEKQLSGVKLESELDIAKFKIQSADGGTNTNWIDLNKYSARALINYLQEIYKGEL